MISNICTSEPPRLVVLDLMLPELDGWCTGRRAGADVLVLFSYYTDGALLLLQAQDVGLKGKIIAAAKKRLAKGPRIKTKVSRGAARLKTRSLAEMRRIEKQNPRAGH